MIAPFSIAAVAASVRRAAVSDTTWGLMLTSAGSGADTSRLVVHATGAVTASLDGAGGFFSDRAGTSATGQVWNLSAGWNATYVKVTSGTSHLVFSDRTKIAKWGDAYAMTGTSDYWSAGWYATSSNSPVVHCSFDDMPPLQALRLNGAAVVDGDAARLDATLTYLRLTPSAGSTAHGTKSGPAGTTYIDTQNASVNVNASGLGSALTNLRLWGGGDLSGSIDGLSGLTYLALYSGACNASGSLASLTACAYFYAPTGSSTLTYPTSGHVWPANMQRVQLNSQALTQAEGAALVIDLASATWVASGGVINIRVTGGLPDTAEVTTALANLSAKNVSVYAGTS